jgi:pimeloyl-ACP methyl ester carboxylesterase
MSAITALQLDLQPPRAGPDRSSARRPAGLLLVQPAAYPRLSSPALVHLAPPGACLRGIFSEAYVARPMSQATVEAHLAPMRLPDIDGAVRPLTRSMVLPEAIRRLLGVYRRQRLTVPTLVVFGRRDRPWTKRR